MSVKSLRATDTKGLAFSFRLYSRTPVFVPRENQGESEKALPLVPAKRGRE